MALLSLATIAAALLPGAPLVMGPRAAVLPRAAAVRCEAAAPAEIAVPRMESAVGFDFVPLLTALQAGEFREADQLTRDGLIKLAGDDAVKRGYVYFTEVPKLPEEDLATIERLWQAYSDGKFGYSVALPALTLSLVPACAPLLGHWLAARSSSRLILPAGPGKDFPVKKSPG